MKITKYQLRKRAKTFKFEKEINEAQIEFAFRIWWTKCFQHQAVDKLIEPFLNEEINSVEHLSWLKSLREAQMITLEYAGQKLGVSRAAFEQYEKNETKGSISLATLKKAAEAINCELIYGLRPKSRKKISLETWEKIKKESINNPWVVNKPQNLKGKSLAAVARMKMLDPEFRRRKNWSERTDLKES